MLRRFLSPPVTRSRSGSPETYESEELAKTEAWLDDLPEDFDPMAYLDQAGQD
jgi:hypothetical protein